MTTTRTFLQNASTRHAIFVQRFSGQQVAKMNAQLLALRRRLIKKLRKVDTTNFTKKRLEVLVTQLNVLLDKGYNQIGKEFRLDIKDFAAYEAEFSKRMFDNATKTSFTLPSNTLIEASVLQTPLKLSSKNIKFTTALKTLSKANKKRIINTITDGIIAGEPTKGIIKQLREQGHIEERHASALVRTTTNHVSTQARQATIDNNKDIIESVEWVSTLDGKTTSTCQALDGKVFPIDSGPRPPMHWGCRSTVIPIVKEEFKVNTSSDTRRPAKGPDGREEVSGKTTYQSWLNKQPKQFQVEVLGEARAELFRQGNLSLDRFVDKNYQPLTLSELRKKEPLAFEKAGLDD